MATRKGTTLTLSNPTQQRAATDCVQSTVHKKTAICPNAVGADTLFHHYPAGGNAFKTRSMARATDGLCHRHVVLGLARALRHRGAVHDGSKLRHTVIRFLGFVAAVALVVVVVQPVVTLGAPPRGAPPRSAPDYHPAVLAHRPAQAPGERSNAGEPFKIPFNVNPGPRPLPGSIHRSELEASQRLDPLTTFNPFKWRGLEWMPAAFQPACYSTSGPWGPSSLTTLVGASRPPTEFTIGSLVDGHSSLLSPPSHAETVAAPGSGVTGSSQLTFQYGFQPAPCGAELLQGF
jgi:hypothetical protein